MLLQTYDKFVSGFVKKQPRSYTVTPVATSSTVQTAPAATGPVKQQQQQQEQQQQEQVKQ
jgi:hypothetical protein